MKARAYVAVSAVVLSLFAGSAALAQTRYTAVVLQPNQNSSVEYPGDINNSGAVVGGVHSGDPYSAYLRNSNGVWSDLGIGSDFGGRLNEHGHAAWTAYFDSSSVDRAFVYDGNQSRSIGSLGGSVFDSSWAFDINDDGHVVGASQYGGPGIHAFVYRDGAMQDIGVVAGFDGTLERARGINNSGQVVAEARVNGLVRAVLYDDGTVLDLGTLGGATATPLRINEAGQVVGYSTTAQGESHAFLFTAGTMMDLAPSSFSSEALGVNASGAVVGSYWAQPGGASSAFIYTEEHGLLDLSALIVGPLLDEAGNLFVEQTLDWTRAVAINDLGQILVSSGNFAVVLTPVPLPAAGWLLGSALMAVFAWPRRRRLLAHS